MPILPSKSAAISLMLAACAMLAGCNNSSSPSPMPAVPNISGDYAGTVQDSQNGAGTATGTFAQHGANAGGSIAIAQSGGTVTAQVALTITSSNAASGSMVIDFANGTTCTFTTTGTYTNNGTTTATLSGSYTAVTNCAGETGTYTLNQQCTDTVTSADRRVMVFPAPC